MPKSGMQMADRMTTDVVLTAFEMGYQPPPWRRVFGWQGHVGVQQDQRSVRVGEPLAADRPTYFEGSGTTTASSCRTGVRCTTRWKPSRPVPISGCPGAPRITASASPQPPDGSTTRRWPASPQRLALLAERTTPDTHHALVVDLDQHHQLTRRTAAESAVLLVNEGTLPLNLQTTQRLAVIGELAHTPRYQGAGSSAVNPTRVVGGLEALTRRAETFGATVQFALGYALNAAPPDPELIAGARDAASTADVVVLFLGLPASTRPRAGTGRPSTFPITRSRFSSAGWYGRAHCRRLEQRFGGHDRFVAPGRQCDRRVLADRSGARRHHRRCPAR